MKLRYRDLSGAVQETTWDETFASSERTQEFFVFQRGRFVERDDLIRKVKYAFMMREHLIVDGPTGAGKSAVLNAIIDNIQGANVWAMDLTKFTTDTHIFGAYDTKKMKEEGDLVHKTEGSVIEANFAKCGEFLDASDPLLRTLLGVMNERKVRRGPTTYNIPLMSLVADTNFRIDDLPGRRQQLAAVLDRFLFQVTVDYVQDPKNRYAMLEMALETAKRPSPPPLHFDDMVRVSGVILENDLVTDRYVREAYQEMTNLFSQARVKRGRAPLSDRRFVKAAHIMEVGAILHGRNVCTFDDLQYTVHVLAQHPDDLVDFEAAKNMAIEKWAAKSQTREIDVERARLREITMEIPKADVAKLGYSDLQQHVRKLTEVLDKLGTFEPQSIEVRAEHTKAFTAIHEALAVIDVYLIAQLLEKLPATPPIEEEIDPALIGPLTRSTQAVVAELRQIQPKSDKARAELAAALEKAGIQVARLEVELRRPASKAS